MNRSMGIDHITLCVKDLHAAEYLFTKILGFEVIWSARDVGSEKSSMDTIVVQRGNAKVALMQGRDKAVKSQITKNTAKACSTWRSRWMISKRSAGSGRSRGYNLAVL